MALFTVHFNGWIEIEADSKGQAEDNAVSQLSIIMPNTFDGEQGDWEVIDSTLEVK